jgi:hypothetical protein
LKTRFRAFAFQTFSWCRYAAARMKSLLRGAQLGGETARPSTGNSSARSASVRGWVGAHGREEFGGVGLSGAGGGAGGGALSARGAFWSPQQVAQPAGGAGLRAWTPAPQVSRGATGHGGGVGSTSHATSRGGGGASGGGGNAVRAYGGRDAAGAATARAHRRPQTAHAASSSRSSGAGAGDGIDSLHRQMARVQRELSVVGLCTSRIQFTRIA